MFLVVLRRPQNYGKNNTELTVWIRPVSKVCPLFVPGYVTRSVGIRKQKTRISGVNVFEFHNWHMNTGSAFSKDNFAVDVTKRR
jgi:hypothetical protein